jgi:hypothetical protein
MMDLESGFVFPKYFNLSGQGVIDLICRTSLGTVHKTPTLVLCCQFPDGSFDQYVILTFVMGIPAYVAVMGVHGKYSFIRKTEDS